MSVNQPSPISLEEVSNAAQTFREKMDTATVSTATPNPQHSSDFEDRGNIYLDSHNQINNEENSKNTNSLKEKTYSNLSQNLNKNNLNDNSPKLGHNSDNSPKSISFNYGQPTSISVLRLKDSGADKFDIHNDYRENVDKESDTDSPQFTKDTISVNNGRMSLCMDKAFCNDANLNPSQALNDSLIDCMSKLTIDASLNSNVFSNVNRPLLLGVSPPQISSTLTVTADHPLMIMSSPDSPLDNNFTDFGHDGPHRNTSKNNLYFSENFTSVDGNIFNETCNKYRPENFESISPNINHKETQLSVSAGTRNSIFHTNRRKIIPCFRDSIDVEKKEVGFVVPQRVLGRDLVHNNMSSEDAISKYVEERNRKISSDAEKASDSSITNSACNRDFDSSQADLSLILDGDSTFQEFDSGPVEFPDSPSLMRRFVLPVELSTNITIDGQMSPDLSTCSTEKDISQFCAVVDPVCGQVTLHHTPASAIARHNTSSSKRRRVKACIVSPQLSKSPNKMVEPVISRSESPSVEEDVEEDIPDSLNCDRVWGQGHQRKASDTDTEEYTKSYRDLELSRSESLTSEHIPEYSAQEERREQRHWMKVQLPGGEYGSIDMKVIEPYKRVISHGGYTIGHEAIIVFSACFLPDNARVDYNYVMDNLFLYVLSTLENLVTDDYIVVYFHGSAERHRLLTFHWLRKCYQLVDRRLRKSLKHIYLVHPTFWLKSIVCMCRPFISSKVSRKLSYVNSLEELCAKVPLQPAAVPDAVRRFDLTGPK